MTMASPPWMPGYVLDAIADQYIAKRGQLDVIFKQFTQPNDLQARLPQVKVPTLILWGKEDRLIDVSAMPLWQSALPHAQAVAWDGIGHMPMVERPGQTAELYAAFLKSSDKQVAR